MEIDDVSERVRLDLTHVEDGFRRSDEEDTCVVSFSSSSVAAVYCQLAMPIQGTSHPC